MTAGLAVAPMAAAPEQVADATVRALAGRAHTVWYDDGDRRGEERVPPEGRVVDLPEARAVN
jgi:hypothetical protein